MFTVNRDGFVGRVHGAYAREIAFKHTLTHKWGRIGNPYGSWRILEDKKRYNRIIVKHVI